jgi:hypothetical protein
VMPPDPMDRPLTSPGRGRWRVYAALGGAAALALTAAGLVLVRHGGTADSPTSAGAVVSAEARLAAADAKWTLTSLPMVAPVLVTKRPGPPWPSEIKLPEVKPPARPYPPPDTAEAIPQRVLDAFEAATGHREPFEVTEDEYAVMVTPLKIVQLPFGPALITERELRSGCHPCTGSLGVYYLREKAGKFTVTGRWPRAVEGSDWGDPPNHWILTSSFTTYPAIYATSEGRAMGVESKFAAITELRPGGPAESEAIRTSYDDEGGSRLDNDPVCTVKGRFANIRKNRSFDIVLTGSTRAVDRYVKRNGRFVPVKTIDWDFPCG